MSIGFGGVCEGVRDKGKNVFRRFSCYGYYGLLVILVVS